MRPHRLSLPLAVTLAAGMLIGPAAPVARAYVRRLSETTAKPLGWRQRTMDITGYSQGLTDMTLDQINAAMTGAAEPWTKSDPTLAACTDLDLRVQVVDPTQAPPAVANDHHNVIAIRTAKWAVDSMHQEMVLALTSVFYYKTTGEIVEADVEVNATDFQWSDVTVDPRPDRQDLQNALTHELGHFIGLDHSCYLSGAAPSETDDLGNPVPQCQPRNDPPIIKDSTMYPSATARDIEKRTLSSDDQKAVCDIYPAGQATVGSPGSSIQATATNTEGCACAIEPFAGAGAACWQWAQLVALAGFGAAVTWARRGRRLEPATRGAVV